jgi:hypothetical protein
MVALDKIFIESSNDDVKLSYLLKRCAALYTVMAIGAKEQMNDEKLFNYYYQGYSTFATMAVLNDINLIKKRKTNLNVDVELVAKDASDLIKKIIDFYAKDIATEKVRSGDSFSKFFRGDFTVCQKIEKDGNFKK